jgi:hypothetical protein
MIGSAAQQPKTLCFARVLSADALTRLYEVLYWNAEGKQGKRSGVQALNSVASLEGDENSCLAEAGSTCVVGFLGDTPYILGFFNPRQMNNATAGAVKNIETGRGNEGATPGSCAGNRGSADVGDQIFGTRGRNRLILRRSGIIEIEASKTCRRTMLPASSTFQDICRNYQLGTDGMVMASKNIPSMLGEDKTYYGAFYKDMLAAENLVTIERGTVSPIDSEIIEKYAIGPANTQSLSIGEPVYVRFRKNTGEIQEAINPGILGDPKPDMAAWYRGIDAEGNLEETINSKAYSIKIESDGTITRETSGDLNDTISGDVVFDYSGDHKLTVGGDQKTDVSGGVTNTVGGDLKTEVTGDVKESYGSSRKSEGQTGEFIEQASGKVAIGNATVELVDLVYRMCQTLSKTLTPGYNGPISTAVDFAKMMVEIQTLKK